MSEAIKFYDPKADEFQPRRLVVGNVPEDKRKPLVGVPAGVKLRWRWRYHSALKVFARTETATSECPVIETADGKAWQLFEQARNERMTT